MNMLRISAAGLALTVLTNCANMTNPGGATEAALCETWGESLPSRSHIDTIQTAQEIQESYAAFSLACPEWVHLIP